MNKRVYNFSAGPSVLPESVLEEVQANLLNYKGNGMSVMEMSHRSKPYQEIIDTAEANLRKIYGISDDYAVLFLQGGASLQFTMIPANLAQEGKSVDYINTGAWAKKAVKEAKRLTNVNIVASSEDKNFSYFPDLSQASFDPNASYVHVTSNNTIFGTQIQEFPKTGDVPLVADMSSDILSREINVNDFGLIYAGAQKNMGPAGVTVVIIRKDLAERCSTDVATMLQYRTHISKGSMFNTPTTFGIYVIGEVLKWIDNQGGLKVVEEINNKKAALLYNEIDSNDFYYCPTDMASRSKMNVPFRVAGDNEEIEAKFIKEAAAAGLTTLKGHRDVGGLRASIYNAMPIEGVQALVDFMKEFAKNNS